MDQKPVTVISSPKQKTKAEKIGMIIVFTVGPILLAFIFYLYGVFSFIGVRIFKGDRISGEITIIVDEKEMKPSEATVVFGNGEKNAMTIENVSSTELDEIDFSVDNEVSTIPVAISSFATSGGEVGAYSLDFVIDKEELYRITSDKAFADMTDDLHLTFKYNNKKWYYITSMKFAVVINSDDSNPFIVIDADYYADNAERYKVTDSTTKKINLNELPDDNIIVVDWD